MKIEPAEIRKRLIQGIGVFLIITGTVKVFNWIEFVSVVAANVPIPLSLLESLLLMAMSLEMGLGLWSVIRPNAPFLINCLIGFLLSFTIYNSWVLVRGGISCGCFVGTGVSAGPHLALALDLGIIGCLVFIRQHNFRELL